MLAPVFMARVPPMDAAAEARNNTGPLSPVARPGGRGNPGE
jgi:hypothetical protein